MAIFKKKGGGPTTDSGQNLFQKGEGASGPLDLSLAYLRGGGTPLPPGSVPGMGGYLLGGRAPFWRWKIFPTGLLSMMHSFYLLSILIGGHT